MSFLRKRTWLVRPRRTPTRDAATAAENAVEIEMYDNFLLRVEHGIELVRLQLCVTVYDFTSYVSTTLVRLFASASVPIMMMRK